MSYEMKNTLMISRRDFLKTSGILSATFAASIQIPLSESLLREVSKEEAEMLKAEAEQIKTTIKSLQLGGFGDYDLEPCAIDVKNGRIIRIRPLHWDWKYKPEEIKKVTLKVGDITLTHPLKSVPSYLALSHKRRVYNPNRVRYPLKRVDFDHRASPDKRNTQNRGVSGFVRISWKEALDIIESEIKRIKDTYGLYSCLVFSDGHGQNGNLHVIHGYAHSLFPLLGGCTHAIRNPDSWEGWYYGTRLVWGFPGPSGLPDQDLVLEDVLNNAELIITNADTETTTCGFQGHFATIMMFWFREISKRIIWITPELNYAGAAHYFWVKGGKWIPIIPNTDAALYLAIAYVWITEGTYDKKFIETHTVGFEDFKKYVLGEEDGVPKTPKWAEPITGIPSRIIKALARLWASKRTTYMNNFGGPKIRGPYASEPARLEACLLAMQGIGRPGVQELNHVGMIGWGSTLPQLPERALFILGHPSSIPVGLVEPQHVPKTLTWAAILNPPISWYGTTAFGAEIDDQAVKYQFPMPGYPEIHMVWNENTCLSACWNPGNKFIEAWKSPKVEFYVGLGHVLENDLLFCDIVLPCVTPLEVTDTGFENFIVFYGEKAIEPIGESKSNYEIYCMLAERFGILDKFTGGKTFEEWFRSFWEGTTLREFMSWDEVRTKKYFVMPFPTPEEWEKVKRERGLKPFMTKYYELPEGKGMGGVHPTPTGKIEFKSVRLEKWADLENYGVKFKEERPPIPHWIPYGKAYEERLFHPRAKKYPLILQSNHVRWRHHVQCDDVTWLREIPTCKIRGPDGYLYEPLWINPIDAAKRGIKHGDIVRVYNDRGAVLCAAYVTERVNPGHVYADHGSRIDPIAYDEKGGVLLDRGGSTNLLAPSVPYTYPLMCVSAYLVEVEKVDIFEIMKKYPDGFKKRLHPDVGLCYDSWVKG
ncbi:MAG: molybdopterin-dependent oxidoreductase [Nitrososphaerota archaeon]